MARHSAGQRGCTWGSPMQALATAPKRASLHTRESAPRACCSLQGGWVLFKANMARQAKLFLRNRAFIAIRM